MALRKAACLLGASLSSTRASGRRRRQVWHATSSHEADQHHCKTGRFGDDPANSPPGTARTASSCASPLIFRPAYPAATVRGTGCFADLGAQRRSVIGQVST